LGSSKYIAHILIPNFIYIHYARTILGCKASKILLQKAVINGIMNISDKLLKEILW